MWQLPLAPVFQPTPHMRHGELDLPAQQVPSNNSSSFPFERWRQFEVVSKRKDPEVSTHP